MTNYASYLLLLNLNKNENYHKLLFISIILDYFVLKTYYKCMVVILLIIIINKYILRYKMTNLVNYLSINIINYVLFIVLSNFINYNFSFYSISNVLVNNFILYITISLLYYYKIINKN